jgi:hypothetical protein
MPRLKTAFCLLVAGAVSLHALERSKIQVVQTHTGIKMAVGNYAVSGTTTSSVTHCSGSSGTYSSEYGFHCASADFPFTRDSADKTLGYEFFFDINVIMPDGARLILHCSNIRDKHCEGIPTYPESTSVTCKSFVMSGAHYKDCVATGLASDGIGVYEAETRGDKVTIYGTGWEREYLEYGAWQIETGASNDRSSVAPERTSTDPPAMAKGNEGSIDPQVLAKANAGDAVAQYKVGYDYYLGQGVVQDYAQAAIWWRKSAEQGYASAQNNLGVLYTTGQGVPQSYAEAYFWQNLAAALMNGPLQARFAKNRDDAGAKLPSVARLRVQERAAQWFAEHPVQAHQHDQK